VFIEAKDDGGGDNWSYKSCKAPFKSSPPTNQHPVFFYRPDALPVAQPTVSKPLVNFCRRHAVEMLPTFLCQCPATWHWPVCNRIFQPACLAYL